MLKIFGRYLVLDLREIVNPSSIPNPTNLQPLPPSTWKLRAKAAYLAWLMYKRSWDPQYEQKHPTFIDLQQNSVFQIPPEQQFQQEDKITQIEEKVYSNTQNYSDVGNQKDEFGSAISQMYGDRLQAASQAVKEFMEGYREGVTEIQQQKIDIIGALINKLPQNESSEQTIGQEEAVQEQQQFQKEQTVQNSNDVEYEEEGEEEEEYQYKNVSICECNIISISSRQNYYIVFMLIAAFISPPELFTQLFIFLLYFIVFESKILIGYQNQCQEKLRVLQLYNNLRQQLQSEMQIKSKMLIK
eukprot:TRINITY_DN6014_c0_g1_i2.p1 TRINITY_DN6014_c0_g1~~TRINITY_DN6014_c0_g1_i2.p1  ORF type:complete len:300 (-),score=24.90 TRINITY_DN6014_c0_g1_i2:68-967(-)